MPRSRLDGKGSVKIEWENGEYTYFHMRWYEELTDGSDTMKELMSKTFNLDNLDPADEAKLTVAVNFLKGIRSAQFPIT